MLEAFLEAAFALDVLYFGVAILYLYRLEFYNIVRIYKICV